MGRARRTKPTEEIMANDCLARRVRLLSRIVTGIYEEAFRPLGLTVAQLNLLVLLARRGPIAPGAVAKLLRLDKSTLSRNVRLMEERGWLTQRPDQGRRKLLRILAESKRE